MSRDSRLPGLLAGRRKRLIGELVCVGFAQASAAVALALLLRHTFDHFLDAGHSAGETGFPAWIGAMVAVVLADGGLRMLERVRAEVLGQDYALDVRGSLFEHLLCVSPRALRSLNRGGLLLRFVGDLTPLRQWVSAGVARIAVASVVIPATLAVLFVLSWKLGALVLGVLCAGALAIWFQGQRLRHSTLDVRRLRAHLATNVSEKLGAMAVVQVHHRGREERRRLARQGGKLSAASIQRASVLGRVRASIQVTTGLSKVGILGLGVLEVAAGRATPGLVVAALAIESILVAPLLELARVFEYWQSARISREKIEGFLALPRLRRTGPTRRRRLRGKGRLGFQHVGLAHVLADVQAQAHSGRITAIVGPNGSGKSSLLALAAGLIEPDRGRVFLDGRDLACLRERDLRRAVGMVGPDLPLLRGTLRKNLCYRAPDVAEEDLERLCALCGVDEIIAALPEGLETRIREGGHGLSIGQRQRIALARALVGSPDVLLLDEVDTNLDAAARAALERVLAVYPGTILIATHDEKLAQRADAVWHLEAGRIREITTPALDVR